MPLLRTRLRGWAAAAAALTVTIGLVPLTTTTAVAADDPPPVVFILDASGSMVRDTATGVSRMDVAKQATADTIRALPQGTDAALLVFGTGTGNSDAERAAGCSDVKTLVPLGPAGDAAFASAIGGIAASGFTPIGPALRQAFGMLPAGEKGTIVLISDGVDTCSPPSSCQIASELHRDNPLVSINVVGFAVDDDEAAQQQMSCIGGVGGGTAVSASDPTQLVARLRAASAASADSGLGARGYRGVQLGMSLDEVRSVVDGAAVGEPKTINGVVVIVVDCGWGTVELRGDRVYAITPKDTSTTTAEGLGPEASLADFEAVYGPPVAADGPGPDDTVLYSAAPGSRVGYRVTTEPGSQRVRYVVVCRCVASSVFASDVANWEIDFDGVGPLQLGMSLDEARAAAPSLSADASYNGIDYWTIHSAGLRASFYEGALVSITVARDSDEYGTFMTTAGMRMPHARGIRMGETAATVENVFPGGTYRSYRIAGTTDYLIANRAGRLITFIADRSSSTQTSIPELFAASPLSSVTVEDAGVTLSSTMRQQLWGG